MSDNYQRMIGGKLYNADDPQLSEMRVRSRILMEKYNQTSILDKEQRKEILKKWLGKAQNCYIEPSFKCDYGKNIYLGDNFYANYDCIILDCAPVEIGDNVMFGPRVNLFTAGHPVDYQIRNTGLEYAKSITIGNNVWLGGNTTILPGVKIGDNAVIGSGAVVTKDIPENVIAVGNPCHILRSITAEDHRIWQEQYEDYFKNHMEE